MSLYKKFRKRMEDEMRHHSDAHDIVDVWSTFMSMMGEEQFNNMLAPFFKKEPGHWENSGKAFFAFHKSLRQADTFNCFVRTKEVPIPDQEGKPKNRIKTVIDESINGQIESLLWTMMHLDKNMAFQETFKFYWDLHQQDVPVVEFVFEKKTENDWDNRFNGLQGVRVEGKKEFLTKKQFDKLFPDLEQISFLIEHGMKKYRWTTGVETKPEDAINYAALESPMHENGREMGEIISWESRNNKPFKFKQTIVLPQPQEA